MGIFAEGLFAPGEEGSAERRLFLAATAALSLVLMAGTEMNSHVFPLFDPIFTFARDISVTAHAASLLVLGGRGLRLREGAHSQKFRGAVLRLSHRGGGGAFRFVGGRISAAAHLERQRVRHRAAGASLLVCLALVLLPFRAQVLAICAAYLLQSAAS